MKQCVRFGTPIPDRIANAPELRIGLEVYMVAFFDLDSERNHSMTPTAIPWTKIAEYCRVFGFDEELTNSTFHHVRKMDQWHLKRITSKLDKS